MIRILMLLTLASYSLIGMTAYAVPVNGLIVSELPSEETYKKIQETSGVPNLRASPTDIDDSEKPQKVPVQESTLGNICLLSLSLGCYTIYKTNKRRKVKI